MNAKNNKTMKVNEAISRFVKNGDLVVFCNFLHGTPYALIHEIIRQKKKNLIAISCSSIEELDLLLSGKCLSKIITSYYHRAGGPIYNRELDRACRSGEIAFEDYTNFTMISMLKAAALGFTFLPVMKSINDSDIYDVRTIQGENKFKSIKCPFTGQKTSLVPALNPDVAICHVQRADKYGNAQFWGSLGTLKWSALAAKKIIVSCEEIVDHEKIKRSPFLTLIPSFRVNAICEVPMGAHPSPLAGYYDTDINFRGLYFALAYTKSANKKWMNEWIYERKDRADYIKHYIERFGKKKLDYIRIKDYFSDQINLGFKQKYWQDGFNHKIALNRDQYYEKIEQEGDLEI
ncbi:MAG: CoA transferase subunit A [Promethearchaeota archaeon]|nr:MAG: CoA transferase subunit A [Candidatus Lokiarchaeota archaeon]